MEPFYDIERQVWGRLGYLRFRTIQECNEYLGWIYESEPWISLGLRANHPHAVPITTQEGMALGAGYAGDTAGAVYFSDIPYTIRLVDNSGFNDRVVLHELAHWVAWDVSGHMGHGQPFVACFSLLAETFKKNGHLLGKAYTKAGLLI